MTASSSFTEGRRQRYNKITVMVLFDKHQYGVTTRTDNNHSSLTRSFPLELDVVLGYLVNNAYIVPR